MESGEYLGVDGRLKGGCRELALDAVERHGPSPTMASMAMEPADIEPTVVFIDDEFSSMSDEDYAAALAAWIAEANEFEPVDLPVTAAETLHAIRERGES